MSILETTYYYTVEEEEEEEEDTTVNGDRKEEYDTEEDNEGDENDDGGRLAGDESTSCPYGPQEKVKWQSAFQQKYSVMHDLGKGRFSVVKRCVRMRDKREFAAKFVRRGRQDQRLTEVEFLLLRRLRHPALVRPHALYTATAKFDIFITELVMGLPLLDWIFTREETTESGIALLLVQVVEALQYLHNHQVAYLDLKPENLLVDILKTSDHGNMLSECPDISKTVIRLIDFGGARHLEETMEFNEVSAEDNLPATNSHSTSKLRVPPDFPPVIVGSPEFMAPEIITRRPVGIEADCWSLGVLIYVLVSGKSPFLGISVEATCKRIITGDVCYPVEYFNTVTQEACDLIHEVLLLNPDERLGLQGVLEHSWFHMAECESVLPVHSLANFCFRRSKIASSTQELPSSFFPSAPLGPPSSKGT